MEVSACSWDALSQETFDALVRHFFGSHHYPLRIREVKRLKEEAPDAGISSNMPGLATEAGRPVWAAVTSACCDRCKKDDCCKKTKADKQQIFTPYDGRY